MKNWSITTWTTIGIGVTVVLLVHIGTISLGQCFRRLDDTNLSQRRLGVLQILDGVKYNLIKAEKGEDNYVWSGNALYLKQYRQAVTNIDQNILELDMFLHGRYRLLADEVKEYIRVRKECAEEVIETRKESGPEAAVKRARELGEEVVTKHIEVIVDELGSQADLEFRMQANEMDRGSMQTVAGIALLMTLAMVILLVIVSVVHKYVSERQIAETSLRIAERRFRAVFNQAFQFSGLLDPGGKVIEVNQSALDFIGRDASGVKGEYFWLTPWWSSSEETRSRLKSAIDTAAGGEMVKLEETVVGVSEAATVDCSVKPVKDEDGRVVFVIVEARDITERKKAEEAIAEREARLRAIVDTAPDGIVSIGSDGTIESANSAMEHLTGYDSGMLVGADIDTVLPNLLTGGGSDSGSTPVRSGERRVFGVGREFYAVRKDGAKVPVEVSLSLINVGDQHIFTGIVRDITQRREAEQRVKEFYSTVSHELRTPLTAIRTALGLLEATVTEHLTPQLKPVLAIASREADRLIRLINDILDIRKIEAGKMDLSLSRLAPGAVVERAVHSFESLAAEASVTLSTSVETSSLILADSDRLQQVFTNLLSNALKWSPPDSSIEIRVFEKQSRCRFEVKDQGPGIPENQVTRLFGRFERITSADGTTKEGTGLGLAIAKGIVEQHGGNIGLNVSSREKGSLFWFELPLAGKTVPVIDGGAEPGDGDDSGGDGEVPGAEEPLVGMPDIEDEIETAVDCAPGAASATPT